MATSGSKQARCRQHCNGYPQHKHKHSAQPVRSVYAQGRTLLSGKWAVLAHVVPKGYFWIVFSSPASGLLLLPRDSNVLNGVLGQCTPCATATTGKDEQSRICFDWIVVVIPRLCDGVADQGATGRPLYNCIGKVIAANRLWN